MGAPAARHLIRAASVETVELAGTKTLKIFVMVNTKNSLGNKAISPKPSKDGGGRAPDYVWYFHDHKWKQRYDPKAKRKASSSKPHAPIFRKRLVF